MKILSRRFAIRALVLLLALVLGGFLLYSVARFRQTGVQRTGLTTCVEGRCFLTMHIHALVRAEVCGQPLTLPSFKGPLSGAHTHSEKNVLHWHDKLEVDPESREPRDLSPLALGAVFQNLAIPLSETRLRDKENGDACPDSGSGTLKLFVNGEPQENIPGTVWKDRDIVDLILDARTVEEAQQAVEERPRTFPELGEG